MRSGIPLVIYPLVAIILTILLKLTFLSQFFSGHAFILTTLNLVIAIKKGVKSVVFTISLTLSMLYLYDLIQIRNIIDFGHTIPEILVGILMGIVLTLIVYYAVEKLIFEKAK